MFGDRLTGWTLALCTLVLTACGGSGGGNGGGGGGLGAGSYSAEIRRTALGIPHIRAGNYGSLGYGLGYAFAEDNLCVLLDDIVTIRGERARYFGRDGSYTIPANDSVAGNVDSDFFWRFMINDAAIQRFRDAADPDAAAATRGYKDGFNRYLREIKAGEHAGRHAACRNGDWLRELTEDDMYRRYIRLGVLAGSSVFVKEIGSAAPTLPLPALPSTAPSSAAAASSTPPGPEEILARVNPDEVKLGKPLKIGSNMYALGPQASANGMPLVFGNPHFPWEGTERLYVSHLTIPGQAEIMGASLYGVPAVLIGFNRHFAWSHTVSTAYRFTLYELTLNPLNPYQYLYDGQMRDMEAVPLAIEVMEADGSITEQTRTLYRSHYGPMMVLQASGVPILAWSPLKAYAMRDANYENTRLINQFFAWNKAQSLDEFKALHKSILGVPWVNTVASGPGGRAYYGDVTVVPNVSDAKASACAAQPLSIALGLLAPGLPLLDGSRSECEWDTDPDAPAPGIFGPANLPTLERDDWVGNFNDSYWLTNPDEPVEGYAKIIGAERSARSLRTRLGILQVQRRLAGSDGRPGNKFDLDNLQDVVLSSDIYSAELALDSVLSTICPLGFVLGTTGPVSVAEACAVLADWDRRDRLDSKGGHIWREFWRSLSANPLGLPLPLQLPVNITWTTQFSAADPVNTPRGLNVLNPQVQAALADAVSRVNGSGFALDAALGTIQRSGVNGDIPLFGGEGHEGAFTIVSANALDNNGYRVTYGNSWIQTVTWDPASGNPVAEGFITYSQSTDPANPHFRDFTEAYSQKQWQPLPFTEAQITAQQIGTTRTLSQ